MRAKTPATVVSAAGTICTRPRGSLHVSFARLYIKFSLFDGRLIIVSFHESTKT